MHTSHFRGLRPSAIAKRAPLIVGGVLVMAAIAVLVHPAQGGDPDEPVAQARAPRARPPRTQASPPVDAPRGDLRSDIARNAQMRPETGAAQPSSAPRAHGLVERR
ncbi:hypothetical protein WKR88_20425 [Trinickia caryophylli]|uniref:hypothetical protein n=1 Tax=Trinickia caryophylli TaxID=28094 RepID=UPI000C87FB51|nr:hypothetical protein [Trinickia caryophylli]PMS11409.1 hypothetical protein C0Z17_14810 [Trinickia caryophylli]TRX17603.1 hypothetical protein FNF07_04725 [Trinickia caryophylli]WQE11644.1 hypothetical protein U0034_18175 [Trinickia caryophylli]